MDYSRVNKHFTKVSCPSSEEHGNNITDHLLHYHGCIKISERKNFFEDDQIWEWEITHQKEHFGRTDSEAEEFVNNKKRTWKTNCEKEAERIRLLREIIFNDPDDKHLVEKLSKSITAWRTTKHINSSRPTENIPSPRQSISDCMNAVSSLTRNNSASQESTPNIMNATSSWTENNSISQDSTPESMNVASSLVGHNSVSQTSTPNSTNAASSEPESPKHYELENDINVPIIHFESGRGVDLEVPQRKGWNQFPNQKMPLKNLLEDRGDDNILRKTHNTTGDHLTYFHIPSNNMSWAECAIGRYFGEEPPNYLETNRELLRQKRSRTYMILRDQYWRSQMHGGEQHNPPHARHMRPLCETISSDPKEEDKFPTNMVLFMPYLHWDTSRKSQQFAAEIGRITLANKEDVPIDEKKAREEPSKIHRRISIKRVAALIKRLPTFFEKDPKRPLTVEKFPPTDSNGRVEVTTALGQCFVDAARLYEGMSNYRDKTLLRKYLCQDPPLHPRRTLDQAYYWTLTSTDKRDRDQVVYRHTTTKPESLHRYDHNKNHWPKHEEFGIKQRCEECTMTARKLSRIVMTDQLWMWILDARTIITCFPKRYGANKQDASGVHKSIRVHFQDSSPDQIRTVFDLALVIIDECSNTLFDRTKTGDRLPQVLDAFSKAIGRVMQKQTGAFEKLWRWTDDASEVYRSREGNASGLHVALLDINPEGKLEREINDIMEELDIMIHIFKTQEKTLISFIAKAETILDPFGYFSNDQRRAMISRYHWNKSDRKPAHLRTLWEAIEEKKKDDPELRKKRDDYNWFKLNADERLKGVRGRIDELKELRRSAENTAESVKDLLALKQQQASVVQAWQAVKQSDETIKQGRSIMMFTLVTIVFLPLSFMSSVFGMNNTAITSDNTSLHFELVYMFSISAGVIFITLLIAFGDWIREGAFYLWKWLTIRFLVRFGLYEHWLNFENGSNKFYSDIDDSSHRRMRDAKLAWLEQRRRRRAAGGKTEQEERAVMKSPWSDYWRSRSNENGDSMGQNGNVEAQNGDVEAQRGH